MLDLAGPDNICGCWSFQTNTAKQDWGNFGEIVETIIKIKNR